MFIEFVLAATLGGPNFYDPKIEIYEPPLEEIAPTDGPYIRLIVTRPLYHEIHLECPAAKNGQFLAIMSLSRVSDTFCTPKDRCHEDILIAAEESCR